MKNKTTLLAIGIVILLLGCGDDTGNVTSAGTVSSSTKYETAQISPQSTSPVFPSSTAEHLSIDGISATAPVRVDVCSAQGATSENGRQMGGARQCLSLGKVSAIPVKHTGPFASFAQPAAITTDGLNLYVLDNDKIRKVSITSGEVTTLAGLRNTTNHKGRVGGAAHGFPGITTDGNHLYVADQEHNEVQKMKIATGELTTLTGFKKECPPPNSCALQGITFDGRYVYALGIMEIFKIDPASGKVVAQFKLNDGSGSNLMPINITTDGRYLYVLNQAVVKAGQVTGPALRKIETETGHATTLVNLGISIGWGADLTTDGIYLYIAVPDRHCVYQVEIATGKMTTLAGSENSYESADGIGEQAIFLRPTGITSDGRNLYVSDRQDSKIRKIVISNRLVTTQAGSILDTPVDGIALTGFGLPVEGMASDGKYLYVSVPSNSPILRIELGTNTVSPFVNAGTLIKKSQEGQSGGGLLNLSKGLVVQSDKLYLADYKNQTILQIEAATGNVKKLAGSGVKDAQDGIGIAASFNHPYGLASDGTNIYVTDYDNHSIRQVEIASGKVTTLAGSGKDGAQDGIGKAASFSNPRGLAYDAGMLYVADYNNNLIRKVEVASGRVSTLAGTRETGFMDGLGREALFRQPSDIVAVGGKLYVADTYNNSIRQIDTATGKVTTLAGSGAKGAQDGVGRLASFNQPRALTKDSGKLYVADFGNNLIRSIDLATGVVETLTLKALLTSDVVTAEQAKDLRHANGVSGQ